MFYLHDHPRNHQSYPQDRYGQTLGIFLNVPTDGFGGPRAPGDGSSAPECASGFPGVDVSDL